MEGFFSQKPFDPFTSTGCLDMNMHCFLVAMKDRIQFFTKINSYDRLKEQTAPIHRLTQEAFIAAAFFM